MEQDIYTTPDAWFVASLLTYGISHSKLDNANPAKKNFIYVRNPEFDLAYAEYFSGRMNIPAMQMRECYKRILDLVKKGI